MSLLPELKRISFEYGFRQRKRLSQNFLIDERVLAREADYASPKGSSVLEVGPGFGFLTRKLAQAGARKIIAIEKDAELIPVLRSELAQFANIQILNGDFLDSGATADLVVSNVPYAISSPILFKLAEMKFKRAVLCLQKEFVDRLLAKPGTKEYSRLSVTSQACFKMRLLEKVPRTAFHPSPKVDSAIIELVPTGKKLDEKTSQLVLLLFQHRKKTLRAALADSAEKLGISKEAAREIAESSGLAGRRVFTLASEEFSRIAPQTCAGRPGL